MYQDNEISDLMQSIANKGLQLLGSLKEQPEQVPMFVEKLMAMLEDYHAMLVAFSKNPEKIWLMQLAYWQDAATLLTDQLNQWLKGESLPIQDKRFQGEEWVQNPFFNMLSQQYLLASEHFNSLLEKIDFGDKYLARRVRFFARQLMDALSPDNFIPTNPQLMAETLSSNGKNLLRGLDNFLSDLEAGSARLIMKMTDMNAFSVGGNVAVTPGKVIYRNELIELIQFTPATPKVKSIPLLMIPPWINKYYILDLSQHNSFVRWLVSQGITVFIISWVNPDKRHADKGFFDYMNEGPMTAIEVIQKQLNVKQVNALGFCIGGTLLATLLAYYKAKSMNPIRSATFLASLIDFSDPGDISVFIDEEQVKALEKRMKETGYLEGQFMANAFNSLRASDLIWSFFIKHYLRGKAPVPFDILFWNADATNMPAKMHSQYLRWMYLHNKLIKPGTIKLNNTPLDMTKIDIPTFFVSTKKDHIAPWETTFLGYQAVKGRKKFLLGGSGHIAGIIIPPGSEKYGYYTNPYPAKNPETWLANATHHKGSWWPEWVSWLKKESGRLINAPDIQTLPYKPIMDAPGKYVFKKAKVAIPTAEEMDDIV
ncbi:PHA/PHB synthase family protein [Legionella yabuuchiae]|uniref:PHA/PHB synthase family protein n=1 Tax=Legionella yabuuchiae TaxID=376727 RepID=UPI001054654A|nr:class I poly(R)-hydroxyalkanoic acid synthase [Legionella yabuuchiae]